MNHTIQKDYKYSVDNFNNLVSPFLEQYLKSKVCTLENVDHPFIETIDRYSGVDAYRFNEKKGVQLIASRIQMIKNGYRPFNTFTIRKSRPNNKTEFHKRLLEIDKDWCYPHLTIQAFINEAETKLLSFGIIYTKELYRVVKESVINFKEVLNKDKSSSFIIVPFSVFNNNDRFMFWQS